MRTKFLVAVFAILALGAGMLYLRPAQIATSRAQTEAVAAPASVPAAIAEQPQIPEQEVSQTLKGRDFSLRLSVGENDKFRDLEVSMDDGKSIRLLRTLHGQLGELANTTFAPGDEFELVNVIPGETREQIVCKGAQWLSRGEGILDTYTLYRIEGDHLQELISVITSRDREEGNGPPAQKLDATLEHTTREGQPAVLYRVKAGGKAEQVIVFLWNGRQFLDASGEYQKIADEYAP